MVGNPQGGVVRVVVKLYIKWGATYSNIKFISWSGITVTEKEVDGNVFDYKQTNPGTKVGEVAVPCPTAESLPKILLLASK